jgi:hypothetical protein
MSKLGGWVGRHRIAAGFAAGALLTLFAVAVMGYLVLADQHRSARVLAAALLHALAHDVHIDRVTEMNPSSPATGRPSHAGAPGQGLQGEGRIAI